MLTLIDAPGPALGQAEDTPGMEIARSVSPDSGLLGNVEFDVNITLNGLPEACPGVTVARPVDAVLVLDRSGSMVQTVSGGATKLSLLQEATQFFARQMNLATDRVAVVQFSDAANIVQSLTSDLNDIDRAIDSLDSGGGTAIDTGVLQGTRELQLNGNDNSSQVLIVFTDGLQGSGGGFLGGLFGSSSPVERAEEARAAGIRVITIGLGQPGEIDADMLRAMASGPADAYVITDASQLSQVYQTIAQSVIQQPVPVTDLVLEHRFDASLFELVPGSVRPQNATINGNIITLSVPQLHEAPVALTYRVRPLGGGTTQIDLGDQLAYNLCGQTPHSAALAPALGVAIQLPTPTPTDTPTTTPTATPTIPPTLTPAPTWTPTPEPPPTERMAGRLTDLRCDTGWLNWLFPLLLLLFFLWLLWRIWKARQANNNGLSGGRGCICLLCPWIPWLAVPLTLLMLWALLSALDFCPTRESLYFWRIQGGYSSGEIHVTDPEGRRPAEQFSAVSSGTNCVGCHAVSSNARRIAAISDSGIGPIVVYDLDGDPIDIPAVRGSYVNWSPDGRLLAVADSNGDIQIIDVESGQISPLAGASESGIFETMPAWSADGTTIAFVRGAGANSNFSVTGGADIYVVPSGGGAAAPLPGASTGGFNYYPSYSPDGRWLAFTRHTTGTTTYAAPQAEIFLVPAAGGDLIRLTANDGHNGAPLTNVSNSWPTWSLDGTRLAFNSKRNDPGYDLFMTDIDENGNSGAAVAVAGASEAGVFEHLPFWGLRPESDPLDAILGLWPFLLGYLLLALLYWLCRKVRCMDDGGGGFRDEPPVKAPDPLPAVDLTPLWQVSPTLLVGVGGTGRWVLTHLKKTLADGGRGQLPDKVRFALLDTSEHDTTNQYIDALGQRHGVTFAGTSLDKSEILLLGPNLSATIGQTADAALAGWFPHSDYSGLSDLDKDLSQGTKQRRPMARAGLITKLREGARAGQPPPDAGRLWQFLIDNSEAVRQERDETTNNDLVRVVLVGSLAGGMSGVLADLAGLLRAAANHALPDGGTVNLEGYFTTEGAFHQYVENPLALKTNMAATARELQRIQLSAGLPSVVDYTADGQTDEQTAHLRRTQSAKLFDNIILFGRGSYDPSPGKSHEPWATTLAAMADVLALRLDEATHAGTDKDYRNTLRGPAEIKQQERNQAIVSSAGSFSLRLPLADMLDIVHTGWARNLYRVFLMGDAETKELSFDWREAGQPEDPNTRASQFLRGAAQDAPAGMAGADSLAGGAIPFPSTVRALAEADDAHFRAYLGRELSLILNGRQSNQRLQRRAPQLGYAEQFTEEVARLLGLAAEAARANAATAPQGGSSGGLIDRIREWFDMGQPSADQWAIAADRLAVWRDQTRRNYESLRDVKRVMSSDEKDEKTGQTVIPGLNDELERRQAAAVARREQMDQVAVRRYLWSRPISPDRNPADPDNQQDLIEEWSLAANERIGQYLNRFHWQAGPDGTVRLSLITYKGEEPIRLDDRDPETVRRLADELIRLAADVTRETAGKVGLDDVLMTQFSSRHDEPDVELAKEIWPLAQPSMNPGLVPGGATHDFEPHAAVGIPDDVSKHNRLGALAKTFADLTERLNNPLNPVNADIIRSTDKTALTVTRSYDLMPLFGLPEVEDAWMTYVRNAGKQLERGGTPSALSHVLPAERAALEYERRLEHVNLLNQSFRQFHPLLVHALQRPDMVEAFALGVAAGWITVEGNEVGLRLPGGNRVALPKVSDQYRPLVGALLRAVAEWNDQTAVWQQLRAATHQPTEATRTAWRAFINAVIQAPPPPQPRLCVNGHPMKPGANFCGVCRGPAAPQGPPPAMTPRPFANEPSSVQDLVAVAVLAAHRRLAGPTQWDEIVMDISRIFAG